MLNRLSQSVYYCRRLEAQDEGFEENLEAFAPPVKRWMNIRSVSGEAVLLSGGELTEQRIVAKIYGPHCYHENDRLFVGKSLPAEFDPIAPNANYRIVSVSINHQITELIMEKLVGE